MNSWNRTAFIHEVSDLHYFDRVPWFRSCSKRMFTKENFDCAMVAEIELCFISIEIGPDSDFHATHVKVARIVPVCYDISWWGHHRTKCSALYSTSVSPTKNIRQLQQIQLYVRWWSRTHPKYNVDLTSISAKKNRRFQDQMLGQKWAFGCIDDILYPKKNRGVKQS